MTLVNAILSVYLAASVVVFIGMVIGLVRYVSNGYDPNCRTSREQGGNNNRG